MFWLSIAFWLKQIRFNPKNAFWNIQAHLFCRKQPFIDDSVNLNLTIQATTMLHVLDDQLRHQHQKTLKQIHILFLLTTNNKVKVLEIVGIIMIYINCTRNILHQHLHMKKLCARLMSHFLRKREKQQRLDDLERKSTIAQRYPNAIFRRFVTLDETWVY